MNPSYDLFIDGARKYHLHNIQHIFRRLAQSVHELGLDAELLQIAGDRGSATMNDNGVNTLLLQILQILEEAVRKRSERAAAAFHHERIRT